LGNLLFLIIKGRPRILTEKARDREKDQLYIGGNME
jgi:hypothetical protein